MREHLRLLHLSTTSSILAFAVIGATLAPALSISSLLCVLLQLFLIGGLASNYFDEICGRPWHTKISEKHLWAIGLTSLFASVAIGMYLALSITMWFLPFVSIWVFVALAYDLELFGGRFHNSGSLAVCWGSVCLGSYLIQSLTVSLPILVASFLVGCIAGHGRGLYEVAKPFSKDKSPVAHGTSRLSWLLLNALILFVDAYAGAMLVRRLLA